MKIHSTIRLAAAIGMLAVAPCVLADEVRLTLSGGEEVPPVTTQATGSGVIVINPDRSVGGNVTTTGVARMAAHIHVGRTGINGPVAITLTKSGDNGWTVPPGARLDDDQYQAYVAGELYVNVHSAEHKGGEIRGQLKPPAMASTPRRAGGY